jgi:hypothetical protein
MFEYQTITHSPRKQRSVRQSIDIYSALSMGLKPSVTAKMHSIKNDLFALIVKSPFIENSQKLKKENLWRTLRTLAPLN